MKPKDSTRFFCIKPGIYLCFLAALMMFGSVCSGQSANKIYLFPDSIGSGETANAPDQYNSFVGNYPKALASVDGEFNRHKLIFDSLNLHNLLQLYSLPDFLKLMPDTTKLVLFNEAHSYGVNRVVLKQALPILKSKGFDCLCMETYSWDDTAVQKYGFPTAGSGWYTNEPNYAEMLRQAVRLGYRLFPIETIRKVVYHRSPEGSIVKLDSLTGDTLLVMLAKNGVIYHAYIYSDYRETDQARNIMRAFKLGCNKIVDLSGYGHIYKASDMMGGKLVDSFKVNPYCIDQVELQEKMDTTNGFSIKSVLQVNKISIPYVNGKPLRLSDEVDAHIVLPTTTFIHNRPSWLTDIDNRKLVAVEPASGLKYPVMIFAYYADEYAITKDAVPVDIFVCNSPSAEAYAALYANRNYFIRIVDSEGKERSYLKKVF